MATTEDLAATVEAKRVEIDEKMGPQRCCNCAAPITFGRMLSYGVCEPCWASALDAMPVCTVDTGARLAPHGDPLTTILARGREEE